MNSLTKTTVVKGSLSQVSKDTGIALAESFLNADCIVLVDVSSSMEDKDAQGGKSRYEAACTELAALQASMPGKIAVLAFSNDCVFCPSGTPLMMGGGTDLAKALQFAKVADVPDMRFVVISDGQPNDPEKTLAIAKDYKNRIDTIYVGPEVSRTGQDFLARLAKQNSGQTVTADRVLQLSSKMKLLLAA